MSNTGQYRSLGLKTKNSGVQANSFFRIIAYFIDAVIIRFVFQGIAFLMGIIGLLSENWMEAINLYLGEGIAPFRGGGWFLEQFFFITSLQDVLIHLTYSVLFLAYFIVLESDIVSGQTIGKRIFGMKVTDRYSSEISFKLSTLRNSTKYLLRVPLLGVILGFSELILLVFYSTRTGDMLADTKVVSISGKGIVGRLR